MFPRTLSAALIITGIVWIIQGAGVAETGSVMDGKPLWAYLGAAMVVAGTVGMVLRRKPPTPPSDDS